MQSTKTSTLLAILALGGCARMQPVQSGAHLPKLAERCAKGEGQCEAALEQAALQGDRRAAGQALLGLAHKHRHQEALAKIALWLEQKPWLPSQSPWKAAELAPWWRERPTPPQGAEINFGAEDGPEDLRFPLTLTPQTARWAGWIAAAAGASSLSWTDDQGATHRVPAAPRLHRLLGFAIDLDSPQSARRLHLADLALKDGHPALALLHLRAANEKLASKDCLASLTGDYLEELLSPLVQGGLPEFKNISERLQCAPDPQMHRYLRAMADASAAVIEARPLLVSEAELESGLKDPRLRRYVKVLRAAARARVEHPAVCEASGRAYSAPLQALSKISRDDLALEPKARDLRASKERTAAIIRMLESSNAPSQRWLQPQLLRRALGVVARNEHQPLQLARLCRAYRSAMDTQLNATASAKLEGTAELVSDQLSAHLLGSQHCADLSTTPQTLSQALRTLRATQGNYSVVESLVRVLVDRGISALKDSGAGLTRLLAAMAQALPALEAELGNSADDRVLRAVLSAFKTAPAALGDAAVFETALFASLDQLDAVINEGAEKNAKLVRLAPGLRLVLGHALALQQQLLERAGATAQLARVEKTGREDLRTLLQFYESEAQLEPLEAVMRAELTLLRCLGSRSARCLSKVEALLLKSSSQANAKTRAKGWWAVGISFAKVGLEDLLSYVAERAGQKARSEAAKARAEESLATLAKHALIDFEVQNTGWEVLRLLPQGHRIAVGLLQESDEDLAWDQVLPKLQNAAEQLTQRLQKAMARHKDEAPDLSMLLVELARGAVDLGLVKLLQPDSLVELLQHLERAAPRYPTELQVYIHSAVGAVFAKRDPQRSTAALKKALALAQKTARPSFRALPLLTALTAESTEGRPKAQLQTQLGLLNAAAKDLNSACEQKLLTAALLPGQALLLERLERHEEAQKKMDLYTTLVDQGLPGDAELRCHIDSRRGNVVAQLELKMPLSKLARKTDLKQSTFQLGFGWVSTFKEDDRLYCVITPPQTPPLGAQAYAFLQEALHALRKEDLPKAARAIDRALANSERARHLGGQLQVDARLLKLVALLARAKGLVHLGLALGKLPGRAPGDKDASVLPELLMGYPDLVALSPLMTAPLDSARALQTALAKLKAGAMSTQDATRLLLSEHLRAQDEPGLRRSAKRLSRGRGLRAWALHLDSAEEQPKALAELQNAKLEAEAGAAALWLRSPKSWALASKAQTAWSRPALLERLATEAPESQKEQLLEQLLSSSPKNGAPLRVELAQRYLKSGAYEKALPHLRSLARQAVRSSGYKQLNTVRALSLAQLTSAAVNPAAPEQLTALLEPLIDLAEQVRLDTAALTALRALRDKPSAAQSIARAYLDQAQASQ